MGVYVISLAVGAFTLPVVARLLGTRPALVLYCSLVAIALSSTGSLDTPAAGHASLSGYLTVWSVCAAAALLAAVALVRLPSDRAERAVAA
ncbi:hypothetical protein [Dactylosporangium sp. NPDC051541]|uniref:hypothetical protein n=1 Tax=Dactylosporangium sp. NPDC051541 TaxID=3363977 RepID=UPI0037A1C3FA